MKYKIVADSSCDLNDELKEKLNISLVPLTINVDDKTYVDNDSLNVKELLKSIKNSKNLVKTSSPSPGDFLKEYEGADNIFVVTLSSALSGTYSSAVLSRNIAKENSNKFIHVFDSLSASVGETLVSMKIFELINNKYSNMEIVSKTEEYIHEMKTFFILESLDMLIKSGRIGRVLGHIASRLSIKLIMGANDDGTIKLVEKVRGSKRAFNRLVDIIGENGSKIEEKVLGIAHCNAKEKAENLKKEIMKRYPFKDVFVVETGGLTSTYANEGGIIVAF